MRVDVQGDCPSAKALRGYLARHDFHLTGRWPDFTVRIEEQDGVANLLLDSIDSELEQAILRHVRKHTATPIEIRTAGGVASDREVRIVLPPDEAERRAVEIGVFRALLDISKQAGGGRGWWRSLIRRKSK